MWHFLLDWVHIVLQSTVTFPLQVLVTPPLTQNQLRDMLPVCSIRLYTPDTHTHTHKHTHKKKQKKK